MAKKRRFQFPTGMSGELSDAPPEVFRAHVIADTIKALVDAGALDSPIQNVQRAKVAAALGVPELFIDAAQDRETVNLDLLCEWKDWHDKLNGDRKAVA